MKFFDLKIKEIISVVRYIPDKDFFSSKNRNSHIIGIQISGNALHTFDDKTLTLKEGCVYFLNQNEDYNVHVREKGEAFSIHFTTYEPISTGSFCTKSGNPEGIVQMLEKIEYMFFSGNDNLTLTSYFYRFCALIGKLTYYHKKDERILNAEKYIHTHFRNSDCISEAAELTGLSRRRFNDLFKQQFHTTPNNYLTLLKISHAKELLKTDGISVSQTSLSCGFKDVGYFCKVFKEQTGMCPGQIKKDCR